MSGPRPIRFQLSRSPWLAAAILGANGLAAACLFVVLPLAPGIGVAALLFALGLATARDRAWLAGRNAVRAIEISGPEQVTLETAEGVRRHASVGPRKIVNRLFVSIPVRTSMRRTILVTADMLGGGEFRALRMWALWGQVPGAMRLARPA